MGFSILLFWENTATDSKPSLYPEMKESFKCQVILTDAKQILYDTKSLRFYCIFINKFSLHFPGKYCLITSHTTLPPPPFPCETMTSGDFKGARSTSNRPSDNCSQI